MTADTNPVLQNGGVVFSDDLLACAATMFLPDKTGLDLRSMCERAIREMRAVDHASQGTTREKAIWRSGDPVWIANHVMMFVPPQLAGIKQHHLWHERLLKLRIEREQRAFGETNE